MQEGERLEMSMNWEAALTGLLGQTLKPPHSLNTLESNVLMAYGARERSMNSESMRGTSLERMMTRKGCPLC